MLPFQFKVKSYYNETGEFTEYFPAESATIIQLILQRWFNETLPNDLDIIAIRNSAGDQLVIDHMKRDIFDYYFIPEKAKSYFHKKTDIQFMFFVLECFFNNQSIDLENNLNQKDENWKFIRRDYLEKDFRYKITGENIWKKINPLAYQAIVLLVPLGFGITGNLPWLVFAGIYFVFLAISGIFQTVSFRQYYRDNKDIEIKLSRGNALMEVKFNSWSRSIPKTDIRKIIKFAAPPDEARANAEYYTEIEFLNGDILNLTSLLIPQMEIESKFMHDLLPLETETTKRGVLKRRTKMDNYFSSIGPK